MLPNLYDTDGPFRNEDSVEEPSAVTLNGSMSLAKIPGETGFHGDVLRCYKDWLTNPARSTSFVSEILSKSPELGLDISRPQELQLSLEVFNVLIEDAEGCLIKGDYEGALTNIMTTLADVDDLVRSNDQNSEMKFSRELCSQPNLNEPWNRLNRQCALLHGRLDNLVHTQKNERYRSMLTYVNEIQEALDALDAGDNIAPKPFEESSKNLIGRAASEL
jgi:hypothetical protein